MVKVQKRLLDKKAVKAQRKEYQASLLTSIKNVLGSEIVIHNATEWVRAAKEKLKKAKTPETQKQLEVEEQNLADVTKNYGIYLDHVQYYQDRIVNMEQILKGGDFNVSKWQISR